MGNACFYTDEQKPGPIVKGHLLGAWAAQVLPAGGGRPPRKLDEVEAHSWLPHVLARIADQIASKFADLLPWSCNANRRHPGHRSLTATATWDPSRILTADAHLCYFKIGEWRCGNLEMPNEDRFERGSNAFHASEVQLRGLRCIRHRRQLTS